MQPRRRTVKGLAAPAAVQTPVAELPGAGRAVNVETFRARRARLAERAGAAVIAVPAAAPRDLEEEALQDTDFRQDDYHRMLLELQMIFTIEPGIYIAEEQLGVRIEDDILVTPEGSEILSSGAPRTPEDIERLMQSAAEPQATGSD